MLMGTRGPIRLKGQVVKARYELRTVCVQGLGFVGAANAIAIAAARDSAGHPLYRVVGVDLPNNVGRKRLDEHFFANPRRLEGFWKFDGPTVSSYIRRGKPNEAGHARSVRIGRSSSAQGA